MYNHVSKNTIATVSRLFYLTRRFGFLLRDYPHTFLQNVVNKGGGELSLKASSLLQKHYKDASKQIKCNELKIMAIHERDVIWLR
jgi:hypothetical protein